MAAVENRVEPGRWASRDSAAPALDAARQPAPLRPGPLRGRTPRPAAAPLRAVRRELGAIALAAGLGVLCAAGSAAVVQADFAVQGTSAEVAQLQDQNRELSLEYAQLQNPQVIEQEAVDQLGMHQPAGYVPVATVAVPPAPRPSAPAAAVAVLPLPSGPAPGGAVALSERAQRDAAAVWGRLHGGRGKARAATAG